jgi:hypothetical protein
MADEMEAARRARDAARRPEVASSGRRTPEAQQCAQARFSLPLAVGHLTDQGQNIAYPAATLTTVTAQPPPA